MSEEKTCFVIMPITTPDGLLKLYDGNENHFVDVMEHLIAPAVQEAGFAPIAPKQANAEIIQAETIRLLGQADLVLCDFSTYNANVMYELGIRTALNKPAIHIRDKYADRLPFDTAIVNCHSYDPSLHVGIVKQEIRKLARHIAASWNDGRDGPTGKQNAMWRVFGIEAKGELLIDGTATELLHVLLREVRGLRSTGRSSSERRIQPDLRNIFGVGRIWSDATHLAIEVDAEPSKDELKRAIAVAGEAATDLGTPLKYVELSWYVAGDDDFRGVALRIYPRPTNEEIESALAKGDYP